MSDDTDKHGEEQPPGAHPPRKTGDTIAVNVGEGATHVAAGKNIIQIGSLAVPRWAALLVVLTLALIAVLAAAVVVFTQQTAITLAYTPTPTATVTPIPTPTPTPLPFAPAAEGETMIVLLPFHSTTATNSEVQVKLWRRISDLLTELPDTSVTAVIDPHVVLTADQQAEAERIGKLHNASMVIWGEDTGVEMRANFLNLREPDFAAADVDIQETQRTQLANPSQYAEFVTRDLPGQIAFLALFAVGQTHYLNNEYVAAIDTIESAVAEVRLEGEQAVDGYADTLAPGLAEAYFRLGWLYQESPVNLDAAIANYTEAIELDPQDAAAYFNRGLAWYDQDDLDRAIADYTEAIKLAPQFALAYNNRGIASSDQGDFDRAIADYSAAITFDPQYAAAYSNRGTAYKAKGDLDRAIADYTKAIKLDPQDAIAYNNRGLVWYDQDNLDRAIAGYTEAIKLDPQYAPAYFNRGNAYKAKGDLDRAIADHSAAIKLDPQYAFAYNNRGNAWYDQGDLDRAIADYTEAIKLDPQYVAAYNNRGNAWYDQGDLDRAIADYTEAIKLDPQDAKSYHALCWSLALQQQPQQAMPHCEQAVALTADPTFINSRGLAHALLGDYPAAIADFQLYADWVAENYPAATEVIEQRRAWIAALARGENPFTPDLLEELNQQ